MHPILLNNRPVRQWQIRRFLLLALLPAIFIAQAVFAQTGPSPDLFPDLLAHRGTPESSEDWSTLPFADQGAWFGFALPDEKTPQGLGFAGPFLHARGRWAGPRLIELQLSGLESAQETVSVETASIALPGLLRQKLRTKSFEVTFELWFHSRHTAFVRARLRNRSHVSRSPTLAWTGTLFADQARFKPAEGAGVLLESLESAEATPGSARQWRLRIDADRPASLTFTETSYTLDLGSVELEPGAEIEVLAALTADFDGRSPGPGLVRAAISKASASYQAGRDRWNRYLVAVAAERPPDDSLSVLAVKAVQTLIANWRGPLGRFEHDGIFPSSNIWYFNGFWAWDTWKHAVGTLRFDAELAKSQVRGMFAHQRASGMIADVVYLDPKEDNWRDTKPPLAGWAIEEIYRKTGDLDFARELYPKLVAYHEFWYAHRDHDQDGLCEYGSTDGTPVAAKWESGMDNAVRFDDIEMLQNGPDAWSMNRESVDLNSYLYREKLALQTLAEALEVPGDARRWGREAERLRERIRTAMWDETTGWFYDIAIDSGEVLRVQGPEGWTPLWTGVASKEQARRVRDGLLDLKKFRTHVPFPTVARDHPEFSDGYWRGLVWLDQAYFAIDGLRRYGSQKDADSLTRQLFKNLEGALIPGEPLRENYHALTGEGRNAKHFSWTSAHLLLLNFLLN